MNIGQCREDECQYFSQCVPSFFAKPSCICPQCSTDDQYKPVCADNGQSYATLCLMQKHACAQKKMLKVVYNAPCGKSFKGF